MNTLILDHITKHFDINPRYQSRISLRNVLYQAMNPFNFFTKPLPKFTALHDISFRLKQGQTLGIIGANGSGKSTLLHIVAGITLPTRGRVTTYGSVTSLFTLGLGFHADLTGRENIYMNAALLGYEQEKTKKAVHAIIEFSQLEKFIDVPIKYYSSGMYARLGFAIATAKGFESKLLLLDETLAVGDITFKKRAHTRLKEIIRSKKTTVLFVHHDLKLIKELCSECLWIDKGKQIAFGKTKKVIQAYSKYFRPPILP